MPTLTATRTADEVIAGWRTGEAIEGAPSPAGPLFSEGYTEQEITMTGGGYTINHTGTALTQGYNECNNMWWYCC